jgi:hypothetical protein
MGVFMVAFGYYVHLVRAAKLFNPAQLYRLNEAGDAGDDILTVIHDQIGYLGAGYHSQAGTSEGFRVRENAPYGRTLWLKVNRGPEGVPGETYDRDNNVSTDTTERIALLSGIRAMLALPVDSYLGLLFCEKVGTRHLKDLVREAGTQPAAAATGAHITLESFAELRDWQREIAPLTAIRISETLAVRDSGDDASTKKSTTVNVIAEGGLVERATERVKGIFLDRVGRRDERLEILKHSSQLGERRRQAEADGVAFQEEAEYQADLRQLRALNVADEYEPELGSLVSQVVPIDRDAAEHKGFSVDLGPERGPSRNIAIEGNRIPLFKYELAARLSDGALRNTWTAHAERIFNNRGVSLPATWAQ